MDTYAGESAQVTPYRSRAATPSFVSHSRNSSAISAQVQATIDQLRSHAGACPCSSLAPCQRGAIAQITCVYQTLPMCRAW